MASDNRTSVNDEDFERLASRLAMLASQDGEADNAGRAVAQLARRMGLSGGDLKEMFLAGAKRSRAAAAAQDQEVEALRAASQQAEAQLAAVQAERDQLMAEASRMRLARYQAASRRSLALKVAAASLSVSVLVGGALLLLWPSLVPPPSLPAQTARPGSVAVVRGGGVALLREPVRGAPVVAMLPPGTRATVRRLAWNMLTQWAELDADGRDGYVATTDIDIF